jgi:hypothetical protein
VARRNALIAGQEQHQLVEIETAVAMADQFLGRAVPCADEAATDYEVS